MVSITKEGLACLKATKSKKKVTVLGIDPGVKGAVACIHKGELSVYDFQSMEDSIRLVGALKRQYNPEFAIIEKQWFWSGERDVKTAEVLIRNAHMWQTLLSVNGIQFRLMSAVQWRKDIIPKSMQKKDKYIEIANKYFGKSDHIFTRHDRAEAALIAYRAMIFKS
jgi:hypothetical protein